MLWLYVVSHEPESQHNYLKKKNPDALNNPVILKLQLREWTKNVRQDPTLILAYSHGELGKRKGNKKIKQK